MNRQHFLRSLLLGGFPALLSPETFLRPVTSVRKAKELNAYYFRAHSYTLVPRHVREDMQWMADAGTDSVSVAILEQDLFAAVENMAIICEEAERTGMGVWAVPSRWGGLVAGAPKVPSLFTIRHPETWKKDRGGGYVNSAVSGRVSSIFHPATRDFMVETAIQVFQTWNVQGIIWDEPKSLNADYHERALAQLGPDPSKEDFIDANVRFYSEVNRAILSRFPDKQIAMFLHANKSDYTVDKCAEIEGLDYYGCDGRPWYRSDEGHTESNGKVLLGGVGQRFIEAAGKQGKKSLWLMENHNLPDSEIALLDRRLPELMSTPLDQLIYYYFPRNLSSPDKIMELIRKHLL